MKATDNQAETNVITEQEVIFSTHGVAGLITLNRPRALNAINLDMIRQISKQLAAWKNDDQVAFVTYIIIPFGRLSRNCTYRRVMAYLLNHESITLIRSGIFISFTE